MSKLYGQVAADTYRYKPTSPATRRGHQMMEAWLQTEYGRLTITMSFNGDFIVSRQAVVNYKAVDSGVEICRGNVNKNASFCMSPE